MCPVAAPRSCACICGGFREHSAGGSREGQGGTGRGGNGEGSGGSCRCLPAAAPSPLPFVTSARAPCPSARAVADGRRASSLAPVAECGRRRQRAAVQKLRLCVMCLKYHTAIPRKSVVQTNDVQGGCATRTGHRSAPVSCEGPLPFERDVCTCCAHAAGTGRCTQGMRRQREQRESFYSCAKRWARTG